jgi:hypothetical protein
MMEKKMEEMNSRMRNNRNHGDGESIEIRIGDGK